ncbi:hypothetical protein AHF37_05567 [Paragonimus kellicotti]|nr:hypothetical protein AHF37_05567 [Paragonimus kellicotti]
MFTIHMNFKISLFNDLDTASIFLELYLLDTKSKPPPPKPPEILPDYADYTNMVEELVPLEGLTYPPNPMYLAADYYHSMQDELNTVQTSDATRNWEPMRKITQSAFRIVDPAPLDTWFNLGVSVRNTMKVSVEAYFNALQMPIQEVNNPTTVGHPKPVQFSHCLLVGGQTAERSATNVSVNDLTIWYRALGDFEAHRFVGYTYSQMKQLQLATYYWTPDLYVLRDSSVQLEARNKYKYFASSESDSSTGVDGYALASIYKSLQQRFRYSTLDHENKSPVPIFDTRPQQYMMLGRRKSNEVLAENLLWLGELDIAGHYYVCPQPTTETDSSVPSQPRVKASNVRTLRASLIMDDFEFSLTPGVDHHESCGCIF